jgi:pseudouridine synthase
MIQNMVLRITSLLFASNPPTSSTAFSKPWFPYPKTLTVSPLQLVARTGAFSTGVVVPVTSRTYVTCFTGSSKTSKRVPPSIRPCLRHYPPPLQLVPQSRCISGTLARRRKLKRLSKKTDGMALSQREKNLRMQQTFAKFGLTTVQDVTRAYQQSLENGDGASFDGTTMMRHQRRTTEAGKSTKKKKSSLEDNKNTCTSEEKSFSFQYKGKKPLAQKLVRVDRLLANRGVGSRADTFSLCKNKRVAVLTSQAPETSHSVVPFTSMTFKSLLLKNKNENNKQQVINGPSDRIPINSTLLIDQTHIVPPVPLLLLYHKPKGVLSTMKDEPIMFKGRNKETSDDEITSFGNGNEDALQDLDNEEEDQDDGLDEEVNLGRRSHLGDVLPSQFKNAGMHPVGRLDYDTSGLLLFSSDGSLTQRLLHPKHGIEKEYVATVEGAIHSEEEKIKIQRQFQVGVKTAEGIHTAEIICITSSTDLVNASATTTIRLIVSEGKHRMVRRMLANVGYPVVELRRERHGLCRLDDLPEGHFRFLSAEELDWAENQLKGQH